MTRSRYEHPLFARAYRALLAIGERGQLRELRRQGLAGARGQLVVIGLGPGHDLDHLPAAVTAVLGCEPDSTMRAAARDRIHSLARRSGRGRPVHLIAAAGEALPLPTGSADSVLCSLVLCSVQDPAGVLAEVNRVLRPGGVLCVFEHVRDAEGSTLGRVQDRLDPAWTKVAGGCHPARRTRALLESAGFDTSQLHDVRFRSGVPLLIPHLVGTASPRVSAAAAAPAGPPAGPTQH